MHIEYCAKILVIIYFVEVLMSLIDTYRGNVIRKRASISKLVSEKAKESDQITKARSKIDSANGTIKRTHSTSTIKFKLHEIARAEKEITIVEKKIADIEKNSKLGKELSVEQRKLEKEDKIHNQRIKEETEIRKKHRIKYLS